jgi:chaperonin GroEL
MAKNVTLYPQSTEKLLAGVKTLADAVRVTLGPKGRHVIVENEYQYPAVTKDGVTVSNSITLPDPVENLGAQIIKQAASTTVAKVGDGTTTATILAAEFLTRSHELITKGYNPVDIKNFLDAKTKESLAVLDTLSMPVEIDSDKLNQIATISANNDTYLGNIIAEAIKKTADSGIVMVEESKSTDTYVDMIEGLRIDKGMISPYFVNNQAKMNTEYTNPVILITDKKIRSTSDISHIMEQCGKAGKSLVIIAEEVEAQAISLIVTNRVRINFPIVAIKAPGFGERRSALLEDIAVFTGGRFISENRGDKLSKVTLEDLGTCEKIIVTFKDTTLIGAAGTPEKIAERVEAIRAEVATSDHDFMAKLNKQRLANLAGAVGIIYVGGETEAEMRERKFRIDDALQATQAAVRGGIVIGGGITFLDISSTSQDDKPELTAMYNESLFSIYKQICDNAGKNPTEILNKMKERKEDGRTAHTGYNALTDTVENLLEAGVIDPTLVISSALTAASSVAQLLITTSATITPEQTQDTLSPMGDDMSLLNQ